LRQTAEHGSIAGYSNRLHFDPTGMLALPCGVLVPAVMGRVIDADTAANLNAACWPEGANGSTTPEADLVLEKRPRSPGDGKGTPSRPSLLVAPASKAMI
jgi:glutamate dehydrogenase (NAD(P)+)